jgi:hypothetical protein
MAGSKRSRRRTASADFSTRFSTGDADFMQVQLAYSNFG